MIKVKQDKITGVITATTTTPPNLNIFTALKKIKELESRIDKQSPTGILDNQVSTVERMTQAAITKRPTAVTTALPPVIHIDKINEFVRANKFEFSGKDLVSEQTLRAKYNYVNKTRALKAAFIQANNEADAQYDSDIKLSAPAKAPTYVEKYRIFKGEAFYIVRNGYYLASEKLSNGEFRAYYSDDKSAKMNACWSILHNGISYSSKTGLNELTAEAYKNIVDNKPTQNELMKTVQLAPQQVVTFDKNDSNIKNVY